MKGLLEVLLKLLGQTFSNAALVSQNLQNGRNLLRLKFIIGPDSLETRRMLCTGHHALPHPSGPSIPPSFPIHRPIPPSQHFPSGVLCSARLAGWCLSFSPHSLAESSGGSSADSFEVSTPLSSRWLQLELRLFHLRPWTRISTLQSLDFLSC